MVLIPIGLSLDLIGAGLLAAAEIPYFRDYVEPNDLSNGFDSLFEQPHILQEGDEGFNAIINLIGDQKIPITPYDWADTVTQLAKSHEHTGLEMIYADFPNQDESVPLTSANVLHNWIEREMDRRIGETYRLWGAILLLTGFLLQITGYFIF